MIECQGGVLTGDVVVGSYLKLIAIILRGLLHKGVLDGQLWACWILLGWLALLLLLREKVLLCIVRIDS